MRKIMKTALALLMALCLLMGTAWAEALPVLQVHQINVGCANCYLVMCDDTALVIDCGIDQEKTAPVVQEYLDKAGFDTLDACIITHWHRDHARNMNRVLAEFADDDTIVYGPSKAMNPDFAPIAKGSYRQMVNFDELQIGGLQLTCLGPARLNGAGSINKDSLNILLTYGSRRILFTGDYVRGPEITKEHKAQITDIDVLQFPHHGIIPYCIDAWVLEIMNPEVIVVPAGFGDNVESLLRKRKMTESTVYDTTNGHVVILTDGEKLEVVTDAAAGQFAN